MATITQTKANAFGTINVVFDAATVAGKVLFLFETKRDEPADAGDVVSFTWTALSADVSTNGAANGDHGRWWYGTSTATATYEVGSCRAYIYETDIDAATFVPGTDVTLYESDNAGTSTTLGLGAVTAPTSSQLILYGAVYDTAFNGSLPATAGSGWNIDYNSNTNASPPTGGSDQHPHTLVMRWNGSTTPLTGSATIGSAMPYAGVMIQTAASPLVTCDSPVAFDVYSLGTATSPALTYLATLCDAFDKSFRVELDGTGSGKFSINRSSADATAAILGDGDGDVRYVQVRIPDIDSEAIFGFFIEEGDFRLLDSDEQGGQTLTFSGHGSLAYLGFATMLAHSYVTGGMDPFTGLWRLYLDGSVTGVKPGQYLNRVIIEAQDASRPQDPLPLLTTTWTGYTSDSNAVAWATENSVTEFSAQIGESVLSVVGRLIGTGAITIQMSPTFVLSAYNSFGTNRTSTTFAANKIRFVGGTNIAEGLTRQIRPSRVATHELVYGESETSVISSLADAATRVTREAYISAIGTDTTGLGAIGDADLAERQLRSESLSVRIALGSDDATGLYLPGPSGSTNGKFWVGDTVTLHTGTGEFDYNNAAFPVAAINVIEGPNVALVTDLEVVVELGSTAIGDAPGGGASNLLSASPGGGSSAVPAHTHPSTSTISPWKEPVRAASTANITISAPGATIDGVTMALQDRFLAKDNSTASQNGIYIWLGAAVAASRAPDFVSGTSALGAVIYATEGTVNADRAFVCTTNETITLGSTALSFASTALLPYGGGEDKVFPHGAMGATETFNPADGNWHTATFDANCTFSLTAPRTGKGCTIFLELAQNATGGWTMTLPASVTNKAALEAAQVTTLSTTSFLMLWTRDGGTTWYGGWIGASGTTSPLTTKGDLWGYDTANARVPVGTNGYLLNADSTDAQGVAYVSRASVVETAGHWEPLMDGASAYAPIDDGTGTDWLFVWVP